MKIDWQLYEEEFDPSDPVGVITLTGADGTVLHQEGAYIDSWLEALITGINAIADGGEGRVDLEDEADPLEFRRREDHVEIGFGELSLIVDDIAAARAEIDQSARLLIRRLESSDSADAEAIVASLRELLTESQT